MKLFCEFHRRMVSLGYHVHCDQNKRILRLFIILDSRYKVTVIEWPLWCFPLPTDTDTELSWTLGPHGLYQNQWCLIANLDIWEQMSVKLKSKYKNFHTKKLIWKCLQNGGHVNPATMGNTWVLIQQCCYWCPGGEAQCWPNIHCFGPISDKRLYPWWATLTHCGLVTPFVNIDLGQHWSR